jgi:hypothetical protein
LNWVQLARSLGATLGWFHIRIESLFLFETGSYLTSWFAKKLGLIMWLTTGNTLVLLSSVFAFFWIPQMPPYLLERAREEKAIEIAGMHV